MPNDQYWMEQALKLAQQAEQQGEIPVGAVIVRDDVLIGEGFNQSIMNNDSTAHAEIIALRAACQYEDNYRLAGTTLYVTLEPCIMCAGAIIHARIARLIFAAAESKTGAGGHYLDIFNMPTLNHRVNCEHGLLAEQSSELLRQFFRRRR